jgi:hypothetical protein
MVDGNTLLMEEDTQVSEISAVRHTIAGPRNRLAAEAMVRPRLFGPDAVQLTHTDHGPLGVACEEIRIAGDRVDTEMLRRTYLAYLLNRTDRMLDGLEQLNLHDMEYCPEIWRSHLAALIAELPFDHEPVSRTRLSPTAAIDIVFAIQGGLLAWITGRPPEHDELLEASG